MTPCTDTDARAVARPPHRAEAGTAVASRLGLRPGMPAVPAAGDALDMGALLRFKALMGHQGLSVQVPRLCFDRLYAYECIALAHASGGDTLRRLALELFQAYHRRDENRDALAA